MDRRNVKRYSVDLRQSLTVAGVVAEALDIPGSAPCHAHVLTDLHCFVLIVLMLPRPPRQQPHDIPPAPADVKDVLHCSNYHLSALVYSSSTFHSLTAALLPS